MTKEEKQLLLKDLSGRLPYGVKIEYLYWDEDKCCEYPVPMILDDINSDGYIRFYGDIKEGEGRGDILTYLPYLRPMSSMTEEEMKEFQAFHCVDGLHPYFYQQMCNLQNLENMFNWLNKHHFDFRGLISKGLALEAPENMYKF